MRLLANKNFYFIFILINLFIKHIINFNLEDSIYITQSDYFSKVSGFSRSTTYSRPTVSGSTCNLMAKHLGRLVRISTRTFACAAHHLYVLCGLGKHSAASLLACDGGACAARPGLIAEKGEGRREIPQSMRLIHGSGRVGEAKYKRRCEK